MAYLISLALGCELAFIHFLAEIEAAVEVMTSCLRGEIIQVGRRPVLCRCSV